ncbi:hypothetical protein M670_01009 [Schinkia azotoformans MEV2011]|uniref:Uncharacterized protein n=1 Tax=Schinkia azotoformans MEV2011 TaxID=1348973 RepID=A0A072P3B6_SCHAZ|nr:hypothetical protein [Schinkia azotoformans]KEF39985.1 hypothetical protein M670_01009 [Schinkia azotoformans MEV2011]MEC1697283.1 hypothetical protein [Schinkia azotoformans]MEC1724322.1 hypothetical protein [Schinkia azotoformans]MEC1771525.1 hypothetical protein [Schinkia azotoformans]MED4367672.1 hypothetical protein [Schinkia azotoformans]
MEKEKQIIEMLTELTQRMEKGFEEVKGEINEVKESVHRIEGLLEGAGYQFKGLKSNRLLDLAEIDKRIIRVESDIYRMQSR